MRHDRGVYPCLAFLKASFPSREALTPLSCRAGNGRVLVTSYTSMQSHHGAIREIFSRARMRQPRFGDRSVGASQESVRTAAGLNRCVRPRAAAVNFGYTNNTILAQDRANACFLLCSEWRWGSQCAGDVERPAIHCTSEYTTRFSESARNSAAVCARVTSLLFLCHA